MAFGTYRHTVSSIDARYFIWQRDEVGNLLFLRLLKAAERRVKVRLLVDDLLFAAKDQHIAAICSHPNFDIKIFNPGKVRNSTMGGLGEFLLYFRELNRRMHNKLFVVDNRLGIVGGRNIGNEYFGLGKTYNFRDLDVLVTARQLRKYPLRSTNTGTLNWPIRAVPYPRMPRLKNYRPWQNGQKNI